ncbi:MAG: hypothetical protein V2I43_26200, partial [Parvularcula sp.]|nr:hypothetical protein [Parvularcula sp.]
MKLLWKLKVALVAALSFLAIGQVANAQNVYIVGDSAVEQSEYASQRLASELEKQGYTLIGTPDGYDHLISVAIDDSRLGSEAFSISSEGKHIIVYGGDARGMVYGALALVEDLESGVRLENVKDRTEAPQLEFRAIKHNLPWDSYRPSAALDQHLETTRDLAYWKAFLDMMAENRFNSLTLWTLHPWPYMISPRNFPEASPFSAEELAEWRKLHEGIFRMARKRGIDTYLVPWNIFVSPEFVAAHGVGEVNTYPHYNTQGDRSELIKRYVRESLTQVLEEYPDLTGVGLSHSEGMGGMTSQERADWMADTYLAAIQSVDRPVKILQRLPQSAGTDMNGSTSIENEQLTRDTVEAMDYADGTIWMAAKFNWSHGHSTPTLVGVHGGELGDTFFEPAPENYKMVWTVRNEDFFALRWGEPSFVREHIRQNASQSYVGGYIIGSETYIPAIDYFTAVEDGVDWDYAFERQWLFYRLWGRLLYNVDTPDAEFEEEFRRRYDAPGDNLLKAFELASRTPLRLASLYNSTWDHTLYSEGMIWLKEPGMDYIGADDLIDHEVLDPAYVSVADYVAANIAGETFDADRITPPVLASQLEADSREALRLVGDIDTGESTALMYEVADVRAWARIGLHLAEKLRGAMALQTYLRTGDENEKALAVAHLEEALEQWDELIAVTRPLYRDMLLTHMIGRSS